MENRSTKRATQDIEVELRQQTNKYLETIFKVPDFDAFKPKENQSLAFI